MCRPGSVESKSSPDDAITGRRLPGADRHARGHAEPELDATSNYELLLGYENGTHTVLRFRRRYYTCDPDDFPITLPVRLVGRATVQAALRPVDRSPVHLLRARSRSRFLTFANRQMLAPRGSLPLRLGACRLVWFASLGAPEVWTFLKKSKLRIHEAD
ncbi:MOXD1 homolog 1 [Gryllus bimaculatus]|nr:MOXD1 homolog 1 [Gryllus bimaculatus]